MIPPFQDNGWLPPGIHPATLDEIDARFGQLSELRRVQMESVRWLVELAVKAGAARIVLNGSFVADIMEPGDVDCVVLIDPHRPRDADAFAAMRAGLPFLDVAIAEPGEFGDYVDDIFAMRSTRNRQGHDRGGAMRLANDTELRNTQAKLARLQERYEALRDKPCEDDELRMASLMSLKKLINQFTEEIVRYQTRQPAAGPTAEPGERRPMQSSHHE